MAPYALSSSIDLHMSDQRPRYINPLVQQPLDVEGTGSQQGAYSVAEYINTDQQIPSCSPQLWGNTGIEVEGEDTVQADNVRFEGQGLCWGQGDKVVGEGDDAEEDVDTDKGEDDSYEDGPIDEVPPSSSGLRPRSGKNKKGLWVV